MKGVIRLVEVTVFAVLPQLFGMFLPYISPENEKGLSGYANLPWGTVDGFGWFLIGLFTDPRQRLPAFLGSLVWPILVTCALFFGIHKFWPRLIHRWRMALVLLYFASLCVDVPLGTTSREPLSYLPLYYEFMFNTY